MCVSKPASPSNSVKNSSSNKKRNSITTQTASITPNEKHMAFLKGLSTIESGAYEMNVVVNVDMDAILAQRVQESINRSLR